MMDRAEWHRVIETLKVIGLATDKIADKMYADAKDAMNQPVPGYTMTWTMEYLVRKIPASKAEEFVNTYPYVYGRYPHVPMWDPSNADKPGQVIEAIDGLFDATVGANKQIDMDEYEYLLDQLVYINALTQQ